MKTTMKLTVIAVVMLMMLMACTPAGTPLSMVGLWIMTEQGEDGMLYPIPTDGEYLFDIRDDDTVYTKYTYNGEVHAWDKDSTIKRCDCMNMTIVSTKNNHEVEVTWSWEISGDKMTWTRDVDGHTLTIKFTKKK